MYTKKQIKLIGEFFDKQYKTQIEVVKIISQLGWLKKDITKK